MNSVELAKLLDRIKVKSVEECAKSELHVCSDDATGIEGEKETVCSKFLKLAIDGIAACIVLFMVGYGLYCGVRVLIEIPEMRWGVAVWFLFLASCYRLLKRWT